MHEHVHLNIRINKLIISLQLNSSPIKYPKPAQYINQTNMHLVKQLGARKH